MAETDTKVPVQTVLLQNKADLGRDTCCVLWLANVFLILV